MILFVLAFYQSLCLLAKKHINERKANGAEERKREKDSRGHDFFCRRESEKLFPALLDGGFS